MATGRKTVVVGQVIDPVTWGNPLWDQSVQVFASDADRTSQYPSAQRHEGALTWLEDVNRLEVWNGTVWRAVALTSGWQAWVPVWTATGGGNSVGTGFVRGRYNVVGTTVTFALEMLLNTGYSPGTGSWAWSLPVASAPSPTGVQIVFGQILPAANKWVALTAQIPPGDGYIRTPADAAGVLIQPGYPLVVGSQILITGSYEAAVTLGTELPA